MEPAKNPYRPPRDRREKRIGRGKLFWVVLSIELMVTFGFQGETVSYVQGAWVTRHNEFGLPSWLTLTFNNTGDWRSFLPGVDVDLLSLLGNAFWFFGVLWLLPKSANANIQSSDTGSADV